MKNNTPMQELIEWIDKNKRNPNLNLSDVKLFVKFNLIEKEKQVIIDAHKKANWITNQLEQREIEAEQYYRETFNQIEKTN